MENDSNEGYVTVAFKLISQMHFNLTLHNKYFLFPTGLTDLKRGDVVTQGTHNRI